MKKLLLVDGMAAVYRAYFALGRNPRVNSKGLNTSCILGFTNTLYDLMRSQQPTHVGVAFDLHKPTFRHEMYPEYKANRDPTPDEILQGLPYVHRMIEAFRIPILTCEGYEADDVIGTLGHAAEVAGFDQVLMATPDKDFAQLVTPVVKIYRFGRGKTPDAILGEEEVRKKFDIERPTQVIDLLGLWGDAVDNIPGIPGVGEKTAKKLVAQFGSIEEMVAHSDEIKNDKLRVLVQQHAKDALFSKKLATINLQTPIAFDEERLSLHTPDYDKLKALCDELEFRQFAHKIYLELLAKHPELAAQWQMQRTTPAPALAADNQPTLFDIEQDTAPQPNTTVVKEEVLTAQALSSMLGKDIALHVDEAGNLSLSIDADHAYTAPLDSLRGNASLATLLSDPQTAKLCFDLKQLIYRLDAHGLQIEGNIFDAQLAHYLLDAEMRHTMDFVCASMLGFEPHTPSANAAALWQLYPLMVARMNDAGLTHIFDEMELPLVRVLYDMERQGIRIDTAALREYSVKLTALRSEIEQEIYALAETQFNINSSKQLGSILFDQLKITDTPPRTGGTKQYSTAEDVLQKMEDKHPIVPKILEYRSLSKLIGTYLDTLPNLINPSDGRIHTVFNQTTTATGRLSSSSPNLQNIPIRSPRGQEIRRAFVPRDDQHLILAADYSQIELRIIASLSQDENLRQAFIQGHDIHAATAARIYHLPIEEVSKEQRRNAKSVNFGIVYGISAFGLSQQLNIPRKEASELINEYFAQYPKILQFIEDCKVFARTYGYARTLLGRRRYLPDINSRNSAARSFAERNAVNMPIQGTSADMIKLAMVRIADQFAASNLRSKMLLQVHDELVFDLYRPEEGQVRTIVETAMKESLPLDGLPIEVSIGVGNNWLEAH